MNSMFTVNNVPLATSQLAIAHKLAKAFGHDWGHHYNPENRSTPARIKAQVLEAMKDYPKVGIAGPTQTSNGTITHVSGSGRVRWTVDRMGIVNFEVWRKNGKVLSVCFNTEAETAVFMHAEGYGLRHAAELRRAWIALLGEPKANGMEKLLFSSKVAALLKLVREWRLAVFITEKMEPSQERDEKLLSQRSILNSLERDLLAADPVPASS